MKDVYIASTVKELHNIAEEGLGLPKTINLIMYYKSAQQILAQASIYEKEKDFERSYIMYYKYLTLIMEKLPRHPQYVSASGDTPLKREQISARTKCVELLRKAEQLKPILENTYKEKQDQILRLREAEQRKIEADYRQAQLEIQEKENIRIAAEEAERAMEEERRIMIEAEAARIAALEADMRSAEEQRWMDELLEYKEQQIQQQAQPQESELSQRGNELIPVEDLVSSTSSIEAPSQYAPVPPEESTHLLDVQADELTRRLEQLSTLNKSGTEQLFKPAPVIEDIPAEALKYPSLSNLESLNKIKTYQPAPKPILIQKPQPPPPPSQPMIITTSQMNPPTAPTAVTTPLVSTPPSTAFPTAAPTRFPNAPSPVHHASMYKSAPVNHRPTAPVNNKPPPTFVTNPPSLKPASVRPPSMQQLPASINYSNFRPTHTTPVFQMSQLHQQRPLGLQGSVAAKQSVPSYVRPNQSSAPQPYSAPPAVSPTRMPTRIEQSPINSALGPSPPQRQRLRRLTLFGEMFSVFMQAAASNTNRRIETCGILAGTLENDRFCVTTLIIPKQEGTTDTCHTTDEEKLLEYQINNDLLTLGWIHTHPTQDCFLSSVDLHTHCSYQTMLEESIAVVISPMYTPNFGVFRLSDPPGMGVIQNCPLSGFHQHGDLAGGTLYSLCSHVDLQWGTKNFKVVDLRGM